jgi:hypothetical protein
MIIDKIDINGIFAIKTEDNPPIGSHGHSPVALPLSLQRVKAKARHGHVLRRTRLAEPGKNAGDLARVLGIKLAAIIFQKQPLEPFVREAPNQDPTVYSIYAVVNMLDPSSPRQHPAIRQRLRHVDLLHCAAAFEVGERSCDS